MEKPEHSKNQLIEISCKNIPFVQLDLRYRKKLFSDVLCYIYTSGTTGNPKPAVIKHYRYYWMCMGAGYSFGIRPDDIIYITMPMYHSAAGILGLYFVLFCFH